MMCSPLPAWALVLFEFFDAAFHDLDHEPIGVGQHVAPLRVLSLALRTSPESS